MYLWMYLSMHRSMHLWMYLWIHLLIHLLIHLWEIFLCFTRYINTSDTRISYYKSQEPSEGASEGAKNTAIYKLVLLLLLLTWPMMTSGKICEKLDEFIDFESLRDTKDTNLMSIHNFIFCDSFLMSRVYFWILVIFLWSLGDLW